MMMMMMMMTMMMMTLMTMRETALERKTDRQTDRQTERQSARDRETHSQQMHAFPSSPLLCSLLPLWKLLSRVVIVRAKYFVAVANFFADSRVGRFLGSACEAPAAPWLTVPRSFCVSKFGTRLLSPHRYRPIVGVLTYL